MATPHKTTQSRTLLYVALVIVALGVLYAIFQKDIQEYGAGLDRIGERQDNYKKDHPNASDKEVDQAFSEGMSNLEKRKKEYKAEHPDATDEQISAAFEAAWNK